jgi:hypothetical protein
MNVSRRAGNPTGTSVYLTTVSDHFLQACLTYDAWTGNEHVTFNASLQSEGKDFQYRT